jgi:hypothetical protein
VADSRNERRTVYIPRDLLQGLEAHADRLDRSLAWVLRTALSAGMPALQRLESMPHTQQQGAAE